MTLNKDLLDILACPKCKGPLKTDKGNTGLICEACAVVYPVKDDIPILIIDEAKPLDNKS